MPNYLHGCSACGIEWEDFYSIHDDPPKKCPECKSKKVKRLISGVPMGRVELSGRELIASLKAEGKKLAREAKTNEKVFEDLVGRDKVQDIVK